MADAANATNQLRRVAESIASGETPIPINWPDDRLSPLLDLVHAARRKRLVRFFARVIANDICRLKRQEKLQSDVKEKT